MGEAAEYEIFRRYGVDISDDGHFELKPQAKRMHKNRMKQLRKALPPIIQQPETSKETGTMDQREAISLIQINNGATLFKAVYLDNTNLTNPKQYVFKDVLDLRLKEGDLVVAQSRDTFAVVKVVEIGADIDDVVNFGLLKHAVAKVDMEPLERVLKSERKAGRALAFSQVREKLDVFAKQIGEAGFENVRRSLLIDHSDKTEE